jgi:hypothetical protein
MTIPCKNPDHPFGMSRETMVCIKDTQTESAWACKACMDVLHVTSVQVRTKPAYQRHVREQLRRQGKLNTSPYIRPH